MVESLIPNSPLAGYLDSYPCLDPDGPDFQGSVMSLTENAKNGIIKFGGVNSPPTSMFLPRNDTFLVFGPDYSLLKETAKKLNYRLGKIFFKIF